MGVSKSVSKGKELTLHLEARIPGQVRTLCAMEPEIQGKEGAMGPSWCMFSIAGIAEMWLVCKPCSAMCRQVIAGAPHTK